MMSNFVWLIPRMEMVILINKKCMKSYQTKKYHNHKPNCQCCCCKSKRGEMFGKNNPMYGRGYLIAGEKNGMFGKKHNDNARKKQSLARLGKKETPEIREIKRLAAVKRWADPEYRKKQTLAIKNTNRTYVRTEEHNMKLGATHIGKIPWNKGYGDYIKGSKNPMYKDGSSIKYPIEFDKELRRKVRQRDKYICQQCFKKGKNRRLSIHHIDGDKNNSNIDNLVSLCQSCHQKIHVNMLFHNIFFKKLIVIPESGNASTDK